MGRSSLSAESTMHWGGWWSDTSLGSALQGVYVSAILYMLHHNTKLSLCIVRRGEEWLSNGGMTVMAGMYTCRHIRQHSWSASKALERTSVRAHRCDITYYTWYLILPSGRTYTCKTSFCLKWCNKFAFSTFSRNICNTFSLHILQSITLSIGGAFILNIVW